MWWVRTDSTGEDRGGFQNRDVGRRTFDEDFGPEFGVDYARFSDSPDLMKDINLKHELEETIKKSFHEDIDIELKVRNGFVILKGSLKDNEKKQSLFESIYSVSGVKEIISEVTVNEFTDDSTFAPHSDQKGNHGDTAHT